MKNRFFSIIISAVAVLAFTGTVMAAGNLVNLKTTVPNIPKSLCYQAGSITMEFSAETILKSGDVIQFTLNNGVVVCKDLDFYLRLHEGLGRWFELGTNTSNPVYATSDGDLFQLDGPIDPGNLASIVPAFNTGYDYGFRVKALAGSQIISLTLGSRNKATGEFNEGGLDSFAMNLYLRVNAGALPSDIFAVSLFDEKSTAAYLWKDDPDEPGIQYLKDADSDPDPFTSADNAICIDTMTFDYQGEFVVASPDSIPNSLLGGIQNQFSGERQIAHILPANEYALVTCKTAPVVGNIILNEGQTASCPPFDFETGANYCGNHYDNKIIIQALTNIFPVSDYKVTLEVKVNGLTGDQGVYIYGDHLGYLSTDTLNANCDGTVEARVPFETFGGPGTCTDAQSVTPGGEGCTVDCVNKVIRATTGPSTLGITQGGNQDFLQLDLPAFRYDSSIVKEGDVVSVRVIVFQDPCGTIFDEEIVIGTFGCAADTRATTLLYPYFTPANGTYFWSAYAITNLSDVEGMVTLYMYESDGDAFKGELGTPVAARTIWTTLVSDSIVDPDIAWTQIAGTGTPGDATCYIKAMTTFTADGFGFIAGSPTGESMGYLPRVDGHDQVDGNNHAD